MNVQSETELSSMLAIQSTYSEAVRQTEAKQTDVQCERPVAATPWTRS
jgi:hypothetical protein